MPQGHPKGGELVNTGSMHSTEGTQIQKGVFLVSSAGLVLATWLADRAYQTEAPDC